MFRRLFRGNDFIPLRKAIFDGVPLPVSENDKILLDDIYNGYVAFPRDARLSSHSSLHWSALTPVQMRDAIDRVHDSLHECESKFQQEEPPLRKR